VVGILIFITHDDGVAVRRRRRAASRAESCPRAEPAPQVGLGFIRLLSGLAVGGGGGGGGNLSADRGLRRYAGPTTSSAASNRG
jgi:hypothetical protein